MWVTRMSTARPALSLDHREATPASPPPVAPQRKEDGEACAAQQAAITYGSPPPGVQDGDDLSAGER
jgi:hypothetical protein